MRPRFEIVFRDSSVLFDNYDPGDFYDEYVTAAGKPRPELAPLLEQLKNFSLEELTQANEAAHEVLTELGATFSFHGETRTLPFDILPRVISKADWQQITAGLQQRVRALNLFCADVYGDQKMIADGKIPREVVETAERYLPHCQGLKPRHGIWCHVAGIDLIRDGDGVWHVLEDNLRVPSGIAYVVKNRQAMERAVPQLASLVPHPENYPRLLHRSLLSLADGDSPSMAVFTPGPVESAYFEHRSLAEQMGIALVEPQHLTIADGYLQRRTPEGLVPIDILYRRRNADFFEPLDFGQSSGSGLDAVLELCHQGRLTIANAFGTGVADDKVVYAYVPEMIRYYLGEEPKLPNVPTYLCWQEQDRRYVLEHLDQLVVKAASGEGGKGMLVGPQATAAERQEFAELIRHNPRAYIAQPTLALSRVPTLVPGGIEGRHVDFRPYVLHGREDIHVYPGGLTRVALKKGSLVVNSTQGGGSKDTWIL